MPDVSAEGGQEEADAGKGSAAKSCSLASMGQSFGEQREEKRHGKIHDAVGGCADDTGDFTIALQCPVVGIVFLEDAIIHGEACVCEKKKKKKKKKKKNGNQHIGFGLPQIGSCDIAAPTRTRALFLFDSDCLESA